MKILYIIFYLIYMILYIFKFNVIQLSKKILLQTCNDYIFH